MKGKDTKDKFVRSLYELAKSNPIDKITVKQISENCGLTSQTFYNHFPDKFELALWAYKCKVDELFAIYREGAINWNEFLKGFINGYDKNSRFIMNAFKNTHGADSYMAKSASYLKDKMEEEVIRIKGKDALDKDVEYLIHGYVCSLLNIIALWIDEDKTINEDKMAEIMLEAMPVKLSCIFAS